jgi:pimeloyl-ACP methyl ester carboxylesterase
MRAMAASDPTALVLVPGLMCTADLYRSQVAALGAAGDVVIADHSQDDTMTGIARRVLEAAPPRFALAGLSMGGYVALEIVRQAPQRVSRLMLIDTSARADWPEQSARRRELVAIAGERGVRFVQKTLLPMLVAPRSLDDTPLVERVLAMADDTGFEAFARQQAAIMSRPDNRPLLAEIRCPTVVAVGAEDQLTPVKVAEEIRDGIPGARLEVIPGAGHLSPMEAPERITAAMRSWLGM